MDFVEGFLDYPSYVYHNRPRRPYGRHTVSSALATGAAYVGSRLWNLRRQQDDRQLGHRINRGYNSRQDLTTTSSSEESEFNEMPKGSYGTYHSTSAGRFGPTRRARHDATSSFARKGFCRESTLGGFVGDSNCVYLGHTPHPVDTTLFMVVTALLRSLFNIMDIDLESQDSRIPRLIDGEDIIKVDWVDATNNINSATWNLIAGGTYKTLAGVAFEMFIFFKDNLINNSRRNYRRIYVANSGGDGTLRLSCNLLTTRINILNSSYLKIQNSTESHHGEPADPSDELVTSVNALPLKGMAYLGRGTYTGLDPYSYIQA